VVEHVARFKPDYVVNAAAYTAVDQAEAEPEDAAAANEAGPRFLAEAVRAQGARMLHLSTDFVFDGESCRPYRPQDAPGPVSVYGATKLAGERAARAILGRDLLVLRTSWVFSSHGHNFVKTMLRRFREGGGVRVVGDQFGAPTSGRDLARVIWTLVQHGDRAFDQGTLHATNPGVASWYDLAVATADVATALGHLTTVPQIEPIGSAEYPTPARRPRFSVLDCSATWDCVGFRPPHWRHALEEMLSSHGEDVDA
jgi:dTDP-4-dehydrorhamnose reductase